MEVKSYSTVIREAVRRKWHTDEQKEWWYTKFSAARRRKTIKLFEQQDGKCFYCPRTCRMNGPGSLGKKGKDLATLDHIIVQKHGGTDNLRNLVMACHACNSARGIMRFEQFRDLRGDPVRWEAHVRRLANIKGDPNNPAHKKKVAKRDSRLQRVALNLAILFHMRPHLQPVFEQHIADFQGREDARRQAKLERSDQYR